MQLITNKIAHPRGRQLPARKRLIDSALAGLSTFNSTVICGRAGAGKTVLAAEIAERCGRKVAWYKVDSSDCDHRVFLRYLLTSISAQCLNIDLPALLMLVGQSTQEDMENIAEMLVFHLIESGEAPLLIVIDDLHLLYDTPWIVPFFSRLLPLLSSMHHVLLLGRSIPPAPLWRMRSKQTLNVIDEAQLAFTEKETAELLIHFDQSTQLIDWALERTRSRAQRLEVLAENLSLKAKGSSAA